MAPPLRAGLVGAGFIGAVHARSIRAVGADLVAVAASDPQSSRAAADRLGVGLAFDDALALVTAPDIDVVHIATPNHLHADLARAALSSGKHVVCEKPLALSLEDATRMCELAQEVGLIAAVPFVNRFYPMAREAREQLQRGNLGAIHTIHGSYLQDWLLSPDVTNWRVDSRRGGASRAFADIGSHWCDLVEWMTGDRITELVATMSTRVAERPIADRATFASGSASLGQDAATERAAVDTEDVAGVLFRTAGGASGAVTVSQVAAGRKNRLWIEVETDKHSIVFNQEQPEQLWVGAADRSQVLVRDPALLSAQAKPYAVLPAGHVQGFHDCFEAFTRDVYLSIGLGHPVGGLPTFTDGVRAARIVEAVLTSAAKHSWIEV